MEEVVKTLVTILNVIVHKAERAKHANTMIFVLPIHAKIMGLVQMSSSWRDSNVNVKISLKVNLAPCHVSLVKDYFQQLDVAAQPKKEIF